MEVSRWEEGLERVGREEKTPQVKIQGAELFTDGPDHATRLKAGTSLWSRVEFQANNTQLAHSTGANVSVMVLQGCKSTPQKSTSLESGHGKHGVWIAIEYSYKLGQKHEFKFCATYVGWFL